MHADIPSPRSVLVTGATGYIGGRLVPRLLERGYAVRCFARDTRKLAERSWVDDPRVTLVEGDVLDEAALSRAMDGCTAAYYLIHSMVSAGDSYRERDLDLAETFARVASQTGVSRIVYLGGLGELGPDLSEHLTSRREVERVLRAGPVPVTALRAAMIIGSASASFEILRYLVERLPAMITPRWVDTECQPIAVDNALHYLVACLDVPETAGRAFDIGGPDVVTYQALMQTMATSLGLRRRAVLPTTFLTPTVSARWIHLVTPVSARFARPLAEGLRNRVVCRDDDAAHLMPTRLLTVREAIDAAVGDESRRQVETSWSDAGVIPGDPDWAGGKRFIDRREIAIAAPPRIVFDAMCSIGGTRGWFAANALWKLRGALDRLAGGPGLSRRRRDPERLRFGDVIDFWRVARIERVRRLVLRAEMRLPGEAELEFEVTPHENGSTLVQIARFKPRGLAGIAYWYAVWPFHGFVFRQMIEGLRDAAERATDRTTESQQAAG
jgi:uncharacterized protein YbjT (DUF2867 family)/uncharacterized protein YndB with AHSA1/START domain